MSLSFSGSLSNYLELSTDLGNGSRQGPWTIAYKTYVDSTGAGDGVSMSFAEGAAGDNYWDVRYSENGGAIRAALILDRNGSFVATQTTADFTGDIWVYSISTLDPAPDRLVEWYDGTSSSTGTSTSTLANTTNMDTFVIGQSADSSPGDPYDGLLADLTVWDYELTTGDMDEYYSNIDPINIGTGEPVMLVYGRTDDTGLFNNEGTEGGTFTENGTVSFDSNNPPEFPGSSAVASVIGTSVASADSLPVSSVSVIGSSSITSVKADVIRRGTSEAIGTAVSTTSPETPPPVLPDVSVATSQNLRSVWMHLVGPYPLSDANQVDSTDRAMLQWVYPFASEALENVSKVIGTAVATANAVASTTKQGQITLTGRSVTTASISVTREAVASSSGQSVANASGNVVKLGSAAAIGTTRIVVEPTFGESESLDLTFTTTDGETIYYDLFLPASAGSAPVMIWSDSLSSSKDSWRQAMRDRWQTDGYVTILVETRGKGSSSGDHDLGGHECRDLAEALDEVAANHAPRVDLTRVYMGGGSGSGYRAVMAALKYPDKYQATLNFFGYAMSFGYSDTGSEGYPNYDDPPYNDAYDTGDSEWWGDDVSRDFIQTSASIHEWITTDTGGTPYSTGAIGYPTHYKSRDTKWLARYNLYSPLFTASDPVEDAPARYEWFFDSLSGYDRATPYPDMYTDILATGLGHGFFLNDPWYTDSLNFCTGHTDPITMPLSGEPLGIADYVVTKEFEIFLHEPLSGLHSDLGRTATCEYALTKDTGSRTTDANFPLIIDSVDSNFTGTIRMHNLIPNVTYYVEQDNLPLTTETADASGDIEFTGLFSGGTTSTIHLTDIYTEVIGQSVVSATSSAITNAPTSAAIATAIASAEAGIIVPGASDAIGSSVITASASVIRGAVADTVGSSVVSAQSQQVKAGVATSIGTSLVSAEGLLVKSDSTEVIATSIANANGQVLVGPGDAIGIGTSVTTTSASIIRSAVSASVAQAVIAVDFDPITISQGASEVVGTSVVTADFDPLTTEQGISSVVGTSVTTASPDAPVVDGSASAIGSAIIEAANARTRQSSGKDVGTSVASAEATVISGTAGSAAAAGQAIVRAATSVIFGPITAAALGTAIASVDGTSESGDGPGPLPPFPGLAVSDRLSRGGTITDKLRRKPPTDEARATRTCP